MSKALDIRERLRDADPLAYEPGLSSDQAQAIRRAALEAVEERDPVAASWPGPLFVAATVAATLVAGIALGRAFRSRDGIGPDGRGEGAALARRSLGEGGRRQLQFATPGGTRIIWVFDPEFNP